MNLYDVAREVTDEVCGEGSYAEINKNNPDPGVQDTIKRASCKHWRLQITDGRRICKDCGDDRGEQPKLHLFSMKGDSNGTDEQETQGISERAEGQEG